MNVNLYFQVEKSIVTSQKNIYPFFKMQTHFADQYTAGTRLKNNPKYAKHTNN
jgi:hypothetical protein